MALCAIQRWSILGLVLAKLRTIKCKNPSVDMEQHICLFVCWVIRFQSQKIHQISEVASVACCLFAQYSKEGLLPSVAGTQHSNDPVHKRKGWMFKE